MKKGAAQKKDCVIVGRCANHILQDNCLSVLFMLPMITVSRP